MKIESLRNFTMLKNCAHVKLVSCKATKNATIEGEETTSISTSDGWRSNRNYFQLRYEISWYKEIYMELKRQIRTELPMGPCQHWRSTFCLHHGGILAKNRANDDLCFLERCSLLYWILSLQPSLLTALHFRIASLLYARHLSVGCMHAQKDFSIDILVPATIEHSTCSIS